MDLMKNEIFPWNYREIRELDIQKERIKHTEELKVHKHQN